MKYNKKSKRRKINDRKKNVSIYGNVALIRGYCQDCKTTCIILDNIKQCCEGATRNVNIYNLPVKRVVEPEFCRKRLLKSERDAIIREQNFRCIYCDKYFGSIYEKKGKDGVHKTRIHFDHFIPFIHSANNKKYNIVASCNICNGLKSDKMFNNIDEVRIYVLQRIEEKGIIFL